MTRCGHCSLPLPDDHSLWHSIHPRDDLPDATEANQWAQDHQGDYHERCCPRCKSAITRQEMSDRPDDPVGPTIEFEHPEEPVDVVVSYDKTWNASYGWHWSYVNADYILTTRNDWVMIEALEEIARLRESTGGHDG